jgi:hypothetical protein
MDEQKELQKNSATQNTQTPSIPSGIPQEMSFDIQTKEVVLENPNEPIPNIEIPTLRTYKSDINQTVNRDKISTAKILIAEQNRQRTNQNKDFDTSIKRPTNILFLILSVTLIVIGVGGIGYFGYKKVVKPIPAPAVAPATFLFVFDQQKFVDGTKDLIEIRQAISSHASELASAKDETFVDVIFYKTNPDTKQNTRITASELFLAYDISLPVNISRNLGKDFVYGLYKTNGKVEPFLVLSITDYEIFYPTMFTWESTLALDIKDLFPNLFNLFDITRRQTNNIAVATSTSATSTSTSTSTKNIIPTKATTTEPILTPEQIRQQQIEARNVINRDVRFIDSVFSNHDARAIRNSNGNPFFYYAFIDKTKILFAQDPKVLNQIKQKIKEKSLVR